jgi:hypothetical protein
MNDPNGFFFRRSPVRKHGASSPAVNNVKYPAQILGALEALLPTPFIHRQILESTV